MLLSFCDLCKDTCPATPTRRWEHIQGELGLEVVVLKHDKPVGDTHLCDKCILNMFWAMLEKSPNAGIKQLKVNLSAREYDCKLREGELLKRELAAKELYQQATQRREDALGREMAIDEQKSLAEELTKTKTIIEAIMAREKEVIRLAEARGKQQAIDEFDNPEYKSSLALRDYKRRGIA